MNALVDPSIYGVPASGWTVAPGVLGETAFSALVWAAVLCVVLVFVYVVLGLVDEWTRTG
ncbi:MULTISPECIES: hypothetical protein [Natrialbaceae]|uniref:hypothetical protein n=1 Tax=Natrialbaceae TaxID=1644061 RepID=UPI00207C614A|nr:hypothetical protein [Natronococcus sp. CG52]